MAKQAIIPESNQCKKAPIKPKHIPTKGNFRMLLTHEISKKKIITKHALLKSTKIAPQTPKIEIPSKDTSLVFINDKYIHQQSESLSILNKSTESINNEKLFISTKSVDEINQIIKKITLGFSAQKHESSFFVSEGIFENTHFNLSCQKNDLDLRVSHCTTENIHLIRHYHGYLAARLKTKEINLRRILFS